MLNSVQITRRDFLKHGSALGAFAASIAASPALARQALAEASRALSGLPLSARVLGRAGYGFRPGEVEAFDRKGLPQWLAEQLQPDDAADTLCNEKLRGATLPIEYPAGDLGNGKKHKAVKENRPLFSLDKPLADLWKLTDYNTVNVYERTRPAHEVRAATWIRAIYSKWQLRELMVEFWHNHFNVNVGANENIAAIFPVYNRLMRKHCFGNFRVFLEEVAKSAAMQYYLNNNLSKASPANENYARELFELHTLGADRYYNHLYNRWREVPGAEEGRPIGYIDQDVYEAARAFTGWTIADGTDPGKGDVFPNTGEFLYHEGWHDNYQKRVLGVEFDPNAPPMSDGRKVLDLLAAHPGTARYLCTKLCQRLVADKPPESLIARAEQAWIAAAQAPDQIGQTLRAIILSPEFAETSSSKVKRPFEMSVSLLRATDADFTFNDNFFWTFWLTGQKMYDWPTPTGHPDRADYWLNTNTMMVTWNIMLALFEEWFVTAKFDPLAQTPEEQRPPERLAGYWMRRLLGHDQSPPLKAAVLELLQKSGAAALGQDSPEMAAAIKDAVHLIALSPQFMLR